MGGHTRERRSSSSLTEKESKRSHIMYPTPEPRKQRAAAMAAKDAMTMMSIKEHALKSVTRREPASSARNAKRSLNSVCDDHPYSKHRRSIATASSHLSDVEKALHIVSDNSKDSAVAVNDSTSTICVDANAASSHDLSSFPRELTVKEVITKTMRNNRISMRGLSRDIVGLMKDMQKEESMSKICSEPYSYSAVGSTDTAQPVQANDSSVTVDSCHHPSLAGKLETLGTKSDGSHCASSEVSTPESNTHHKDEMPITQSNPAGVNHLNAVASMKEKSDSLQHTLNNRISESRRDRTLMVSEKILMIADFDAGMLPHELEAKYDVSKIMVADVLRNRISIIRQQASSLSDRISMKRRRTNFVGLNILMWRYFCECRDRGLILNGRQLKEHALTIARQLGLHNFKGSEGWLDSFKRRHNIDLKTMSGHAVLYESDSDANGSFHEKFTGNQYVNSDASLLEDNFDDVESPPVVDANQFLIAATDAAAARAANEDSAIGNPPFNINCIPSSENRPAGLFSVVHLMFPV
ncbi:hypothetical protein AB6A40_008109 [Gnathostoma spinigerum]|uniref:HTH CENPB-type domain-containing protein n=1 Tax=Gnathostoma spinigerum TaxID=75299 RepID=A0ABD6EPD5_9BILA